MQITTDKISILVVDDEVDIREILEFNLENEGYEVDAARSAEEASKMLSDKHQLILLDVMMGGMSGFKFADHLRKSGNNIPIIFLTAKDTENDMLTGFSIGGDDYISKPFSIKEVIARVKSILKRVAIAANEKEDKIKVGGLEVDLLNQTVTVDGQSIDLTKTEYNILLMLLQDEGRFFSRTDILNRAWGNRGIVVDRTVDVHIARLRKKIGPYGDCVVNRTGYGYGFVRKD